MAEADPVESTDPSPQAQRIAYFAVLLAAGEIAGTYAAQSEASYWVDKAIAIHNAAVQQVDGL